MMISYLFLGVCYKIISFNSLTVKLYRMLGNIFGSKRRISRNLPQKNVDLGNELISLLTDYCKTKPGDEMLELGTGWMHWFSVFIKVFNDVNITLFDIWDNRQFDSFKSYITQLNNKLKFEDDSERQQSNKIIRNILNVNSFDGLYNLLNFQYIIQRDGSLRNFPDNNFDVIFSVNVMEHIERNTIKKYVNDIYRTLKPGGYSVQIIDLGDHYHYLLNEKHSSIKEYLRFSQKRWKLLYENKIQYINKIQFSEWKKIFEIEGFKEIYCKPYFAKVNVVIHSDYKNLNENDIKCYMLSIVHRKE